MSDTVTYPHPSAIGRLGGESLAYTTDRGAQYIGDSAQLLTLLPDSSIDLVLTSPPFALLRQKSYGNESQDQYVAWLSVFGRETLRVLRPSGSLVLDLGGAYQRGVPVRSLYNYRVLIEFCDVLGYRLAEEFFWHNTSKLPSPIEWVNKRKIRAKDSVNTVWWLSKADFPKADVSKVRAEYSSRMRTLLRDPAAFYKPRLRPSEHQVGTAFARDNGGSIPSNLLQFPNTESTSRYLQRCRLLRERAHPARFPADLPRFFIRFLTDPDDLVLDIFSGSNTTGFVAEQERRRWLSFELDESYARLSSVRFMDSMTNAEVESAWNALQRSDDVHLGPRTAALLAG
jgi:site-specific DNA-methyltransferase (cytosine-N4-specific)